MNPDALAWRDFFTMVGGAAAALTGLVFVALSLRLDQILAHPFHRFRAGVAIASLTSQIVLAGIVLVPGQSHWAMGAEIVLTALVFVWIDVTAARHPAPASMRYAHPLQRQVLGLGLTVVFLGAGGLVFLDSSAGFYLLALGIGIAVVTNIRTAWSLMTELGEAA